MPRDPFDAAADMPESVRQAFRDLEFAFIERRAACGGVAGDKLEGLVILAILEWLEDEAADAAQDAADRA